MSVPSDFLADSAVTPTADVIRVLGLSAVGRHGVYDDERVRGQQFCVDLAIWVDTRTAAASDDLTDAVDYSRVSADVVAILSGTPVNLIETVAEDVAACVLAYDGVGAVDVTVHKPQAPMGVPFADVSMSIRRYREQNVTTSTQPKRSATPTQPEQSTTTPTQPELNEAPLAPSDQPVPVADLTRVEDDDQRVVVALGANLGTAWQTLARAIVELDDCEGITVDAVSGLFRTAPQLAPGQSPQPDYYNAVAILSCALSPQGLLGVLHDIEDRHGRQRRERWGARTLDLDIITFGEVTSDDPALTLPHPRAATRAFVLAPWWQADPQAKLEGTSLADLLAALTDQDIELVAETWIDDACAGQLPRERRRQPKHRLGSRGVRASAPAAVPPVSMESAPVPPPPAMPEPDPVHRRCVPRQSEPNREQPARVPRLIPDWRQAIAPVSRRIIDDEDGDEVAPRRALRQRPRVEPGLAESIPTGLIPIIGDEMEIERDAVVRPTATGAIRVVRSRARRGDDQ